jgi:hypothetical protein
MPNKPTSLSEDYSIAYVHKNPISSKEVFVVSGARNN